MSVTIGPKNKTGPQGPVGPKGPDGIPGRDGSQWHNGNGEPDKALGQIGDFYLDGKEGDVYRKFKTGWKLQANIMGPRGPKGEQGEKGEKGRAIVSGDFFRPQEIRFIDVEPFCRLSFGALSDLDEEFYNAFGCCSIPQIEKYSHIWDLGEISNGICN